MRRGDAGRSIDGVMRRRRLKQIPEPVAVPAWLVPWQPHQHALNAAPGHLRAGAIALFSRAANARVRL